MFSPGSFAARDEEGVDGILSIGNKKCGNGTRGLYTVR